MNSKSLYISSILIASIFASESSSGSASTDGEDVRGKIPTISVASSDSEEFGLNCNPIALIRTILGGYIDPDHGLKNIQDNIKSEEELKIDDVNNAESKVVKDESVKTEVQIEDVNTNEVNNASDRTDVNDAEKQKDQPQVDAVSNDEGGNDAEDSLQDRVEGAAAPRAKPNEEVPIRPDGEAPQEDAPQDTLDKQTDHAAAVVPEQIVKDNDEGAAKKAKKEENPAEQPKNENEGENIVKPIEQIVVKPTEKKTKAKKSKGKSKVSSSSSSSWFDDESTVVHRRHSTISAPKSRVSPVPVVRPVIGGENGASAVGVSVTAVLAVAALLVL